MEQQLDVDSTHQADGTNGTKKRKLDENQIDEDGNESSLTTTISASPGADIVNDENKAMMSEGGKEEASDEKSSFIANGNGNKRTHLTATTNLSMVAKSNDSADVYFKILIPSTSAGSVIGRGGERIAQIQKDTNVKMKMSKANEFYPNTNERVCLIVGSIRSVLNAHEMIVERILEKANADAIAAGQVTSTGEVMIDDRLSQIKILIPNSTAGLLIGKAGSYIKQIKDESGSFVQISPKQTDLPERVVTIEGEPEKRSKALQLVIKKIADDPQHNSVTNLSYANLMGNANMNGNGGNNMNGNGNMNGNLMNNNGGNMASGNGAGLMNGGMSMMSQNGMMGSNGGAFNLVNGLIESFGASNANNKFDFNSAATYLAGLNNLALLIINCGGSNQMTPDTLKV